MCEVGWMMDKSKFDMLWKTALLIVLTISIIWMFYEWRQIDKEAMACKNAPFIWGQMKASEQGMNCSYYCEGEDVNPERFEIQP